MAVQFCKRVGFKPSKVASGTRVGCPETAADQVHRNASTLFKSMKAHWVSCCKRVAVDQDIISGKLQGNSWQIHGFHGFFWLPFFLLPTRDLLAKGFAKLKKMETGHTCHRCFGYTTAPPSAKVQSLLAQATLMTCASPNSDVNSKKHLCV